MFVGGSRMHCSIHICVLKSYAAELSVSSVGSSCEDVVILFLLSRRDAAFPWNQRSMIHHDFGTVCDRKLLSDHLRG